METSQVLQNAQKAEELAFRLFPNEQWIGIDQHIFMAASRAPRSDRQSEILEQELSQARILAALGHTVYLLPESGSRGAHANLKVRYCFVRGGFFLRRDYANLSGSTPLNRALCWSPAKPSTRMPLWTASLWNSKSFPAMKGK